jgi:O-antigen ligase
MGFFFTLAYILIGYFTPTALFGELGAYHLETVIVALALIFSIASWSRSGLSSLPQTKAIAGLCFVVVCSIVFNGLKDQAAATLLEFLPNIACFFLIVLNFRSKGRLQILVAGIFIFAVCVIYQGMGALNRGDIESPYLLDMGGSFEHLLRIRGLGIFADPNDFGQLMVGLIPCLFFFWRKGHAARNFALVYVPVGVLVYGMFLTHSRGGMLALMMMAIVAGRRKIGLIPGIVGGGLVFVALSAAGFSGGRDVSASAGDDRISLWSQGLDLLRSHPIFGVGYGRFQEHTDVGLTAHNTFVVCAGELGLVGVFCWLLMAITTIRNGYVLGEAGAARQPEPDPEPGGSLFPGRAAPAAMATVAPVAMPGGAFALAGSAFGQAPAYAERNGMNAAPLRPGALTDSTADTAAEHAEIRRMASLTVLSFAGFFTAGWFLSRAYTMALFVNAGIAAAIFQMAVERGIAPPQMPTKRMMKVTAVTLMALFVFVYVIIRADRFMPK